MKAQDLARCIDHTLLRADAAAKDIEKLCAEARAYNFYAVCVNGSWVTQARHFLDGSDVKVATVVGFPLGATDSDTKRFETEAAIDNGAQEIDVVINIGRLKDGDDEYVLPELRDVVEAAAERPVKVIIETCLLTNAEKIRACRIVLEAGAQFVKTSTGFNTAAPTTTDLIQIREIGGVKFGTKSNGGMRAALTGSA